MIGRGRLFASAAIAVLAVLGGLASRRLAPATGGDLPEAEPRTGAWYCPHGGGEGWRAWLVVANPGDADTDVVVTTLGGERPAIERTTVEAGRQRLVPVPSTEVGGATTVEYFGTAVGAGMVVARAEGSGIAAEPCVPATARRWYVPDGTTVRGQRARLVIANPTATEAVVDVALVQDQEIVEPGRLEGIVLEAREGVGVDLGAVALGQRTVTAVVTASLGQVVVSGVGMGERSLRSVIGTPEETSFAAIPAAIDAEEGVLVVMAAGGNLAFRADAVGADGPRPEIEDGSIDGGTAEALGVRGGDVTIVVRSEGPASFVAARRLQARTQPGAAEESPSRSGRGSQRDRPQPDPAPTPDAATLGTPVPSSTVLVPSPLPPQGGRSVLTIFNAGSSPARVEVTLLTPDGAREPAELRGLEVGPGRTLVVGLTEAAGEGPVTALVETNGEPVVAAQTGVAEGGYAATSGVPWPPVLTY